jgi:plasmid stabilization system protein ParE
MAKEVIWLKRASDKLKNIFDYLLSNWNSETTENFIEKVNQKVSLLQYFPNIGLRSQKKPDLRRIILSQQNILIYRQKGNKIIIVNIFDTRQNPDKMKF